MSNYQGFNLLLTVVKLNIMEINAIVAFTGGLVSFFAPCVVPLLPTYVAYIFGIGVKDKAKVIEASIFYLLGFSLIFVFLGAFSASIGALLRSFDFWFIRLGGVILILFGLETLGLFYIPSPAFVSKPTVPGFVRSITALRSFFLGVIFSLVWTPCIGPILGSILLLAGSTRDALSGAFLLFIYSLGISLPFLIISIFIARSRTLLTRLTRITPVIAKIAGVLLIIMGGLLLTDTFKYLNSWIFEIAYRLGYQVR